MTTTDHNRTDPTDPRGPTRPSADRAAHGHVAPRRMPFELSATQLVATGLAATTATIAASYLGVTGTVIGAALASVLTAAGKEVYSHSLRSTGDRVRGAVPVTRALPRGHDPASPSLASATATAPGDDEPPALPAATPRVAQPNAWRRIAIGAIGVFVAVLAVITAVEVIAGRPVSDVVRGDTGKGTSFFGAEQVHTKTVPPTAPTVTKTIIPKIELTTPTVTQTAPPATTTTTPPASSRTTAPRPGTSSTPTPSKTSPTP